MSETPIKKNNWAIYNIDPTVGTTPAYADRDLICEMITLDDAVKEGATASIRKVVIIDQAEQSSAINLLFFHTTPTSTFTKNAEFDCTDADADNTLGVIKIAGTDYLAFADNSIATRGMDNDLNFPIYIPHAAGEVSTPTSIYMAVISGGTPTYAAAGDLRIQIWIDRTRNITKLV